MRKWCLAALSWELGVSGTGSGTGRAAEVTEPAPCTGMKNNRREKKTYKIVKESEKLSPQKWRNQPKKGKLTQKWRKSPQKGKKSP